MLPPSTSFFQEDGQHYGQDVDDGYDDDHAGYAEGEGFGGEGEGQEEGDDVISTIFLVSDDPRLRAFGAVYCFNGRDTFGFGEEKTGQTTMDASVGVRAGPGPQTMGGGRAGRHPDSRGNRATASTRRARVLFSSGARPLGP